MIGIDDEDGVTFLNTLYPGVIGHVDVIASAPGFLDAWIDLKNKADALIYSTERTLEEFAENITDEDREGVQAGLEKAKGAIAGEDAEALERAIDELSGVTYQMTEKLYAELGGAGE